MPLLWALGHRPLLPLEAQSARSRLKGSEKFCNKETCLLCLAQWETRDTTTLVFFFESMDLTCNWTYQALGVLVKCSFLDPSPGLRLRLCEARPRKLHLSKLPRSFRCGSSIENPFEVTPASACGDASAVYATSSPLLEPWAWQISSCSGLLSEGGGP